eukprot:2220388-Prymnesium_polylepis.1
MSWEERRAEWRGQWKAPRREGACSAKDGTPGAGSRTCHVMCDACSDGKMASTGGLPLGMCSSSVD